MVVNDKARTETPQALLGVLKSLGADGAADRVAASLPAPGGNDDRRAATLLFSALPRYCARQPLPEAAISTLAAIDADIGWASWSHDDLARATLLCGWDEPAPDWLADLRRCADLREHAAILKALPLLPSAPRRIEIAREGCRAGAETIFRAIACFNPYPHRFFDADAYDQVLLKALFLGVPVDSLAGLGQRLRPETFRMIADYRAEREAAGRAISEDIRRLLELRDASST